MNRRAARSFTETVQGDPMADPVQFTETLLKLG